MSTTTDAVRATLDLIELQRQIQAELDLLAALGAYPALDEDDDGFAVAWWDKQNSADDPWDSDEWDLDCVALGAPRGHDESWCCDPDDYGGIKGEDDPLLQPAERNAAFKAWLSRTELPADF
jgi:hypothetical protein